MNRTIKQILANTGLGSLVSTLAMPLDTKGFLLLTLALTVLLELTESVLGSILTRLLKRS